MLPKPGYIEDADAMAPTNEDVRPAALHGHVSDWNGREVAEAHRLGLRSLMDVTGAADGDEGYAAAVGMGADALQTDYPERLPEWLRAQGRS
jgi:hypothetical protein